MKIEITYPPIPKRASRRKKNLPAVKFLMMMSAFACLAINLEIGGKAWSLVVVMSLYMIWTLVLSPDLVEYNRISQFIKFVACLCVLLTLIDVFLSPGWAVIAVPVIFCCGLSISGILFLTDLEKQKQNMLPMLLLIAAAIIGTIAGLCVCSGEGRVAFVVMGVFACSLLFLCVITLGHDFMRELRCRFHTQ